jgi:N-acetylglucosaminyldiphosphoundecaprenol N-acetyl-beta-D-mannosaminyltransferase
MYFRYGDENWDSSDANEADRSGRAPESDGAGDGSIDARPSGNGHSKGNGHPHGNGNVPRGNGRARPHRLPTVDLRGVRVHAVSEGDAIRHIMDELGEGHGGMVVTPNLDHLHRCLHDVAFAAMVSEAELVLADGMPLVWAARLQGTPLPQRVAGSNLITSLSQAAASADRSVFLLGGSPGTAEGAARALAEKFPSLKVAGTLCPPIGFDSDAAKMAEIIQLLSAARPDVVFVALGSPKQERLIVKLRPLLPQTWWLGVGISFSFLCGDVRRAPLWMQKCGLEWLHRLVQEPRRLFRRYVVVGIPFAFSLLGKATLGGLPRRLFRGGGRNAQPEAPLGAADPRADTDAPAGGRFATLDAFDRALPASVPTASAPTNIPAAKDEVRSLSRLKALVLLGGSVRPTALGLATGRSVLDLPLDENGSVFNGWLDQAAELKRELGLDELPVRVMVNQNSADPSSADARHFGAFRVERDLSEYRGTGGVLHDLARDYADDDLVLVANAAQILMDPLPSIVAALHRRGGDVTVVSHEDGTPSGIMLVACKTLRQISGAGYVDMKEQALPEIATRYDVRVLARRRPTGLPIRTLEDYIQALRYHHRRKAGTKAAVDPLAEDWNPTFALIEPGAQVDPTSRVHDSVVLKDSVVEAGAVLVRSVVCRGGVLRRDKTAVETFVTATPETRRMRRGRGFPVVVPAGAPRLPTAASAPASSPASAPAGGDVVS